MDDDLVIGPLEPLVEVWDRQMLQDDPRRVAVLDGRPQYWSVPRTAAGAE